MITTITGSNKYLNQQNLSKLIDKFVVEYGDMALERIDGEDVEFDKIRAALESLPFLSSKKLVVLRNPSANKLFIENVELLLGELSENTDVIIFETKLDKRLNYFKYLKKNSEYIEQNELDEQALIKWTSEQAKLHNAVLNSSKARYLIDRVGTNQHLLANEISKLASYNQDITIASIDLLTEPNPQSTIFQLLESAFSGNIKQIMNLYAQQKADKVEPQQLIAMLAWQFHVLAVIKYAGEKLDSDISKEARINPFVIRKSRLIADKISLSRLKELISQLTKLDTDLKSKNIDSDDAVLHYLLTINT